MFIYSLFNSLTSCSVQTPKPYSFRIERDKKRFNVFFTQLSMIPSHVDQPRKTCSDFPRKVINFNAPLGAVSIVHFSLEWLCCTMGSRTLRFNFCDWSRASRLASLRHIALRERILCSIALPVTIQLHLSQNVFFDPLSSL